MSTALKEHLVIAEFKNNSVIVWDFDTAQEAKTHETKVAKDGVEIGFPQRIRTGYNMDWVCPVCDGGPGNYCSCSCPKG